jgi:hypothetical protein
MDRKEAIENRITELDKTIAYLKELGGIDEPKQQKRWWFDTISKAVSVLDARHPAYNSDWLEVTESYARYLSNKPEGECELRIVLQGEEYWSVDGCWQKAGCDGWDRGMNDLGYRWVKTSALRIVDVVDGKCNGYRLILGEYATDDSTQAQYIYSNGQESPHSWLWADPSRPMTQHYSVSRSKVYCKEVTPVKVVCARRGK